MNDIAYYKLIALASAPDALERAAEYLPLQTQLFSPKDKQNMESGFLI